MKYIFTFLFSLFLISQSSAQTNPLIQQIINEVNIDSLTKFVNELSGEVPVIVNGETETITTRYYSSASNDIAADYIKNKFESYGLTAYDQMFSSGRNVYAVQTGTTYPDEIYIFCGHYDDMPWSGPALGADDNASGTAAVIEAARVLSNYLFEYTIIYAAWDAEEIGLVGSEYYADLANSNNDDIKGVLNFDMIGYDSNNDMVAEIHTRNIANSNDLKNAMMDINNDYAVGITPSVVSPGISASDHASFWDNGFGAILLIENYYGDFNAYYHSENDLIEHFNLPYFQKNAQLGIGTMAQIAAVESLVPVELVIFTANVQDSKVNLNWQTSTEINNHGFEIQRSTEEDNFSNWATIGFVEGNGNSTSTKDYNFVDNGDLSSGKYMYRLKQVDYNGAFEFSSTVEVEIIKVDKFTLEQNYPNPFNPSTIINYSVAAQQLVSLKVYDVLGKEIGTLINKIQEPGNYQVRFTSNSFNNINLPSGVYIYTLRSGDFVKSMKMILAK